MSEVCSAVALGQLEHLDELVNMRKKCAKIFAEAVGDTKIMASQKVNEGYENAYWAYTTKLTDDSIDWKVFRDKYLELGGDSIYAAWKLTYQEPFFRNFEFLRRDTLLNKEISYEDGICPVAEALQPRLLAFKSNYYDLETAKVKAEALRKTINYFETLRQSSILRRFLCAKKNLIIILLRFIVLT